MEKAKEINYGYSNFLPSPCWPWLPCLRARLSILIQARKVDAYNYSPKKSVREQFRHAKAWNALKLVELNFTKWWKWHKNGQMAHFLHDHHNQSYSVYGFYEYCHIKCLYGHCSTYFCSVAAFFWWNRHLRSINLIRMAIYVLALHVIFLWKGK